MDKVSKMGLLENALVVLFDGKRAYWGHTNSSGQLVLPNVIAGTYKIVVVRDGYIYYEGEIKVDADKTVNITLSPIPVYKPAIDLTLYAPIISHEENIGERKSLSLSAPNISYEVTVA